MYAVCLCMTKDPTDWQIFPFIKFYKCVCKHRHEWPMQHKAQGAHWGHVPSASSSSVPSPVKERKARSFYSCTHARTWHKHEDYTFQHKSVACLWCASCQAHISLCANMAECPQDCPFNVKARPLVSARDGYIHGQMYMYLTASSEALVD